MKSKWIVVDNEGNSHPAVWWDEEENRYKSYIEMGFSIEQVEVDEEE